MSRSEAPGRARIFGRDGGGRTLGTMNPLGAMNPVVAYTLGRIGVFAAVAGVLYLIGFRNYALVLLALLISMPLSYLVLRRQRTAFADSVSERLERRRAEKESLRAELRGDASEK